MNTIIFTIIVALLVGFQAETAVAAALQDVMPLLRL